MQEHGVTYDQLTEAILGNQVNPDILAMRQEIKALKEGVDKTLTDRDTQAEQAALAEMRKEAVLLAKSGDDYELCARREVLADVMELIKRTYKSTGEILDVSEAMGLVEEELTNESLKLASKEGSKETYS